MRRQKVVIYEQKKHLIGGANFLVTNTLTFSGPGPKSCLSILPKASFHDHPKSQNDDSSFFHS